MPFLFHSYLSSQGMQFIFTIILCFIFILIISKKAKFKLILKLAIIFIIVYVVLLFIPGQELDNRIFSLIDSLNLFNRQAYIQDVSTLARVDQISFAYQKILENPIIGNGIARSINMKSTFGKVYFFYSDIGLIGLIFIAGFLGLSLYLYQVFDSVKRIRIKQIITNTVFDNALVLYLLFIVFSSFMTGISFNHPYHFLTILVIIVCRQQAKI